MTPEQIKDAAELFDCTTNNLDFDRLQKHVGDRKPHDFLCDDRCGVIGIMAGPDGDLHAFMRAGPSKCHFGPPTVRARTHAGGGRSERVRVALMLLALAIDADAGA